jgi:pilus assembly protein Flp/PilA
MVNKAALHPWQRQSNARIDQPLYRHERGATATEYAMLVVFIALAIAVGAQALGSGLGNTLTNIGNMISTVIIPNV